MGDEYATVCGSITESVSKAFAEDYCSNFLEVGEYADTEAAIINNVQFWNNWCYNCVVTANWIQALLSYDGLQAGR